MDNLIFTEKRTFSKDCQDEQASAVDYINLTLVDEEYLIWLFLNSYHSFIVVEDLDVQVRDDFSQKERVSIFFDNFGHFMEEIFKLCLDIRKNGFNQL